MRLIDADSFENVNLETLLCFNGEPYVKVSEMFQLIKNQPTAYDVEKVEKELKDAFERLVAEILNKTNSEYTIVDFNIKPYSNRICDIVRKGGIGG